MTSATVDVHERRRIPVKQDLKSAAFPLGPLDRLALGWLPIVVVFSYGDIIDADILQAAVIATLKHYPTLTGKLVQQPGSIPHIESQQGEVEFVIADCDADLGSFIGKTSSLDKFPDHGLSLVPKTNDLFALQLTRFRTGSTLALHLSHVLTDVDGLTQLGHDLSNAYRSIKSRQVPIFRPSCMTSYSPVPPSPGPIPAMYTFDAPQHGPRSPNVCGKVIRFPETLLSQIKTTARPEKGWVSTFDALCAHLFQRIHSARVKTGIPLSPPDYFTAVNIRTRLGLPERYFPMATLDPYHTFDSNILLNAPLSEIASVLHELTSSFTASDARQTVEWLAVNPEAHHRFRFGNGGLMVTKWSGFDLFGVEFESRPLMVSLPFTGQSVVDGLVYMIPTSESGAIDVYVCLDQEVWDILEDGEELLVI
jgi:hypothetical protein